MTVQQKVKRVSLALVAALSLSAFANAQDEEGEEAPFEHPTLNEEQVFDSKHFRVHYTLTGEDAVDAQDDNANGIPDYVEAVSLHAEKARALQLALGWAAPPTDGDWGGNSLYDIYLLASELGAGFTDGGLPESTVGDNPNTPDIVEKNASFSYIGIGSRYAEASLAESRDFLKILMVHEYHHAIQFGYDGLEPLDWLWEAGASWMEGQVYDNLDGSFDMLNSVFKSPDSCQVSYGGETRIEDDGRWYGLWVFLQHISETYGHNAVKAFWEEARNKDAYEALDSALARYATDLETVFKDYSVALLTRQFKEGKKFPTLRLEATLQDSFSATDGVGQLAADYLELELEGSKTIHLDAEALTGMVVGIKGSKATVFDLNPNSVSLNADEFEKLYLLVLNLERSEDGYTCEPVSYRVNVSEASTVNEARTTKSSANFEAPLVEGLADFEGAYESITPPEHLLPSYLPSGLELIDAYEENSEGSELTVLFFTQATQGDAFLDIYAEATSFTSLKEWLDDQGYSEDEQNIEQIANQAVHFESYDGDEASWHLGSFIKDGEHIEVISNLSQAELRRIIKSIL